MKDFVFHNPGKIYFGPEKMNALCDELAQFGKRVLLVYGGGSIKKNGLYDTITARLQQAGFTIFELSGVEPNPRHSTINKGAAICEQEHIDVILAVGGGSTIDAAKGMAALALSEENDVWNLVKAGREIQKALPIVAVLTNAATGSEMDIWAVISNMDTNEKIGITGTALVPKAAFENPEHSYSLPAYQTASGAFDILNHVLDKYYLAGDATFDVIRDMQEAVMRSVVKWAPVALQDPENYEARANLMYASTLALNGILDAGSGHKSHCHNLEHELSAYYDVCHGHGLAILTPRWLQYILDENTAPQIYRLGTSVFGVEEGLDPMEGAKKAIAAMETFNFETLGLASSLSDLGIGREHFADMAGHITRNGPIGGVKTLTTQDLINIYEMCL